MRWARWLRVLGTLVLVVVLYFVVPVRPDPAGGIVLRSAATGLLLAGLAAVVVVEIRQALVDEGPVDWLITAIVIVWAVFALAFYVLNLHQPHELAGMETRLDALYFAASTMLTVGYGDVHASGQIARALVLVQMVFDIAFVATAGAVLSARVRSRAEQRAEDRGAVRGRRRGRRPRRVRARSAGSQGDSQGNSQ